MWLLFCQYILSFSSHFWASVFAHLSHTVSHRDPDLVARVNILVIFSGKYFIELRLLTRNKCCRIPMQLPIYYMSGVHKNSRGPNFPPMGGIPPLGRLI